MRHCWRFHITQKVKVRWQGGRLGTKVVKLHKQCNEGAQISGEPCISSP